MNSDLRGARRAGVGSHCSSVGLGFALVVVLLWIAAPAAAQSTEEGLRASLAEAQQAGASELEKAEIQQRLGRVLTRDGSYSEAAKQFEAVLIVRQRELPADDPAIAKTLTGLAVARNGLGQSAKAEELFKRSLAIQRKAFGDDSAEVAPAYSNLGALYVQLERWDEAAVNYDRAIMLYEKSNDRRGSLILALAQRAGIYERQGQPDKADEIYERIIEVEARGTGAASMRVAAAHTALAGRYRDAGKRAKAEKQYRAALEILGGAQNPSGPSVAINLEGLGWAAFEDGRIEEAEQHYRRALGIAEGAFGRDNPLLIPILQGYVQVMTALGRTDEAGTYAARVERLEVASEALKAQQRAVPEAVGAQP